MWEWSQVLIAFSEWIFHWLGSICGKELAFPLCSTLPTLLSVKYSYMYRSTSVLSIMFLWFICISLCKYYIVFTTRAYSKSRCLIIHVFLNLIFFTIFQGAVLKSLVFSYKIWGVSFNEMTYWNSEWHCIKFVDQLVEIYIITILIFWFMKIGICFNFWECL